MRFYLALKTLLLTSFIVLVGIFIYKALKGDTYFPNNNYKAIFPKASSELFGSAVKFKGVRCGRVGQFAFQGDSVVVQLELVKDLRIPIDSRILIKDYGISSDIHILPPSGFNADQSNGIKYYEKGDTIKGSYDSLGTPKMSQDKQLDSIITLLNNLNKKN